MPREVQGGLNLPMIRDTGHEDAVAALYSNEGMDPTDERYNPYNVTLIDFYGNARPLPEIKLLIPEGYRDVLSLDTNTQARLNFFDEGTFANNKIFKARIRAMITKIPGPFLYTSYR